MARYRQSSAELKVEIIQLEKRLKEKRKLLALTEAMEELMMERSLKLIMNSDDEESDDTPTANS